MKTTDEIVKKRDSLCDVMRNEIYQKTGSIKNTILTIRNELNRMLYYARENLWSVKKRAIPRLLKIAEAKLKNIKQQLGHNLAIIIFQGNTNHACVLEYVDKYILIYDPQPDNKYYKTPLTVEIIANVEIYRGFTFEYDEIYIVTGFKF